MNRLAACCCLIVFACLARGADDKADALQKRREETRRNLERSINAYPLSPRDYRLADIIQLRSTPAGLAIAINPPEAPQSPQKGAVRLKIRELPGLCYASIRPNAKPGEMPDFFSLSHLSFTEPDAVQFTHQFSWNSGSLTLGHYSQLLLGYRNYTLHIATDKGAVIGRGPVRLMAMGMDGSQQRIAIQRQAADLLSLRRDYPEDVDQYARPLLRSFGLECLLAPDRATFWQAFADEIKPDPAILAQVQQLLPRLDADSFQEQEKALRELMKLGLPMAIAVASLDRAKLSAQQNVFLDTALSPYQAGRGVANVRLKDDPNFLIDCLYVDDPGLRAMASRRLSQLTGREITMEGLADPAERAGRVDALRRMLPTSRPVSP